MIDSLVASDWVARLEEEGNQRLVLLCDPATTRASALIDLLLLGPDERVRSFRDRAGFERMSLADLLPA